MIFENAILIAFTKKVPYLPVINIIHPLLFLCANEVFLALHGC